MAILIFCYLHLYINIIKNFIWELKTKYHLSDGRRIYPWILLTLDFPQDNFIHKVQRKILELFAYLSLPISLIFLSTYYVKKHSPILSYIFAILPVIGIIIVYYLLFYHKVRTVKPASKKKKIVFYFNRFLPLHILLIYSLFLITIIIPNANNGFYRGARGNGNGNGHDPYIVSLYYNIKKNLTAWFCVNLSYQTLIDESNKGYNHLFLADLEGSRLEGALLQNSILTRANLSFSSLADSNLSYSNLEEANLNGADLRYCFLINTNFKMASLFKADLRNSVLRNTILTESNLEKANLENTNIDSADMRAVNLNNANLSGARFNNVDFAGAMINGHANCLNTSFFNSNLEGASLMNVDLSKSKDLTIEQISKVKFLYNVELPGGLSKEVKKNYPHLIKTNKDLFQ